MLFVLIGVLLLLVSLILKKLSNKYNEEKSYDHEKRREYSEASTGSLIFACISFGLLVVCQVVNYYFQVNDLEKLNVINREIEVHKDRASNITSELETILVDKYSDHEEKVFESLSGEGISIYLANYPELNSHKTFMHLSETLTRLSDKQYESKLEALELEKDIKSRERYIHIIPYFLPK